MLVRRLFLLHGRGQRRRHPKIGGVSGESRYGQSPTGLRVLGPKCHGRKPVGIYLTAYIAWRASDVAAQRITLSAWNSSVGGIVMPRARAVFRLMSRAHFVGCSTGRAPAQEQALSSVHLRSRNNSNWLLSVAGKSAPSGAMVSSCAGTSKRPSILPLMGSILITLNSVSQDTPLGCALT
jgi:hypothetical protein